MNGHTAVNNEEARLEGDAPNNLPSPSSSAESTTSIHHIRVTSIWSEHAHALHAPLISSPTQEPKQDDATGAIKLNNSGDCFDSRSRAYLWLCSIVLLFGWVANNIGWIYVTDYFGQMYGFWEDQSTAVIYIVLQAPVVCYRLWISKSITKEMRDTVSWEVYAIMGLFDSLYNLLTGIASPYVSGSVQNLIFQLPIPIAMVCVKIIWPKTTYLIGHYVGSIIIVGGACMSVLPAIIHPSQNPGEQDNRASALIVYMIGTVFYGIGTVYKSYALKNAPTIDYWYVSMVENIWAFLLGFVFLPVLWIPGVSLDTPSTSWPHFVAGAKCMFYGTSDMDPNAVCANIWWISILWVISNIGVNVLGLVICRLGDSVIYNIINSVQLPVTNLCFTSSFIMTAALTTPFTPIMWVAVFCVMIGFGIYQFLPLEGPRPCKPNFSGQNGTTGEEEEATEDVSLHPSREHSDVPTLAKAEVSLE